MLYPIIRNLIIRNPVVSRTIVSRDAESMCIKISGTRGQNLKTRSVTCRLLVPLVAALALQLPSFVAASEDELIDLPIPANMQKELNSRYVELKADIPDYAPRTEHLDKDGEPCLLYTSPSPRDLSTSRMPSSA